MTDPNKPHAFAPSGITAYTDNNAFFELCAICGDSEFAHSIRARPINPNEGRPAEVDASGEPGFPPEWIAANRRSLDLPDKQPQPAAKPARHDYYGLCFELRKSAHFLGMANERPGLIEHCKNAADALDAQAAEIVELRNTLRNSLSEIRKLHPENAVLREALDLAHKAIEACIAVEQNPTSLRCEKEAGKAVMEARKARAALKGVRDE